MKLALDVGKNRILRTYNVALVIEEFCFKGAVFQETGEEIFFEIVASSFDLKKIFRIYRPLNIKLRDNIIISNILFVIEYIIRDEKMISPSILRDDAYLRFDV